MFVKRNAITLGVFTILFALLFLTPRPVHAAPMTNVPVTVTQPDGTRLNLFASGDEYYNWLHDGKGYTIVQDPVTGYYVYADLVNGELVPTEFIVGEVDAAATGLRPFLNISPERKEEIRHDSLEDTQGKAGNMRAAPRTGTMTNLIVFIRFSDEAEFTDPTSKYTEMLNSSTPGANSLRNYYREVSYNALTINSSLFPTPGATILSYQDSHPRGYYQPYNGVTNPIGYTNDRGPREHTLLRDAINYVNSLGQFPSGATIDADGDGVVDSLTFVVRGSPGGWSELLWPHAWVLYSYPVRIQGKLVSGYQFQLQTSLNTGVLAHEMFHVLGAPDLYHYVHVGNPVGGWDLMAYNTNPPQHMSCYMKYKYGGWISSLPVLPYTTPATYVLNPLTSPSDNCKKIASPYSTSEFFVVEYRNTTGGSIFENTLPGSGMLVYRINTLVQGNSSGPPDEVYVYRRSDVIDNAHFSSNVGRTAISDSTNPSSVLSNGSPGGLNLCNIGAAGITITFDVCLASTYTISGNAGVSGATLSYMDGTLKTVTAKGDGSYSLPVSAGWSGSVSVSKPGFTFSPSSRSYASVFFNYSAQNYNAIGVTNLLQDPGFEAFVPGSPYPYWAQTSTTSSKPLCTSSSCSLSEATGPQTGSAWGQFTINGSASISQTVTIPRGTASLEFYLWIGYAQTGSDAADAFAVKVDGAPVFSTNATQINSYRTYTFVSLDVSAYADGAPHTITFSSAISSQFVAFNVDDVALFSVPLHPDADAYEPDNLSTQAKLISVGSPQAHNIIPATDVDWVKFQLATPSAVILETNGAVDHDTRMWLYNSSLVEIGSSNDEVSDRYSYLDTCHLPPLPAGTYYVKIDEFENNQEIPSYTLSFRTGACVNMNIGGINYGSYAIPQAGSIRQNFTGANNGPVKMESATNVPILGGERLIYKSNGLNTSFTEMMGLPNKQLDTVYWLPWYNNVDLDTQLRFANTGGSTATVHVWIAGVEMPGSPFTLQAGESVRKSFPGVNHGPVKIVSDHGVPVIAAARVIYKTADGVNTSFSEMMALPNSQLDKIYWLPWYNNKDLDTQLRFANVSNMTATVRVYVGGQEMAGSPFTLLAGESARKSFAGINNGPVKIVSNQNIVAAERLIYKVNGVNTSFTETMALPDKQRDTVYWLPWYNNANPDLDTQLRFANASSTIVTVRVFIGGLEMPGSPFTLAPGASTRQSFPGVNNGPVKIVSTANIVAAERLVYKVSGVNTSFAEMMALPNNQLDTAYWLPWYNNVDLDTQLRFGVP